LVWVIEQEIAAAHGKALRWEDWPPVVVIHLRENRQEAMEDVRIGSGREVHEYVANSLAIRFQMCRRISSWIPGRTQWQACRGPCSMA
jgi:hypothetical protein